MLVVDFSLVTGQTTGAGVAAFFFSQLCSKICYRNVGDGLPAHDGYDLIDRVKLDTFFFFFFFLVNHS